MPEYELIKSLEREGFRLDYPDNYSIEDKIIKILKEKEKRLYLAIPILLEKNFDYEKIKKRLLKLKEGEILLREFNKIILITKEIFKKTKRNSKTLEKLIKEENIKEKFTNAEFEYYFKEFKESKETAETRYLDKTELSKRTNLEMQRALENIFSPAKIRILKKIYEFKDLTSSEKTYYYRDIKPMIDSILNNELQDYLKLILKGRRR
ncbi:MAG: hypothetical protein ACOCUU_01695 [Nanoarchaeota archaeon]